MNNAGALKQVGTNSQGTWEQFSFTEVQPTNTDICTKTAANGDFNVQISSDATGSYLTFLPNVSGMGSPVLLVYYSTSPNGTYPGYFTQPNTAFKINANPGETVYFYYTYSLPAGGENNTANDKMDFIMGDCSNSSARLFETTVEKSLSTSFSIYPNPVKGETNVEISATGLYDKVVLSDLNGSVLQEKRFDGTKRVILNTSTLNPGIYFVQLSGKEGIKNSKLVKQ